MVNATVTEIAAPGTLDRHGEPSDVAVVWAGSVAGYLSAPRMARQDDGREVDARPVRFTMTGEAAAPLVAALTSGADGTAAEVTIVQGAVETIYTLKGLTRYEVGSAVDSVRLELRKGRVQ